MELHSQQLRQHKLLLLCWPLNHPSEQSVFISVWLSDGVRLLHLRQVLEIGTKYFGLTLGTLRNRGFVLGSRI